ncbi:hypothetical protein J3Q64DRAFT_1752760 [Phycomyces blakesleeanus]|uniref:Uncharacterized protein n=1 Tax=Phycomyces blakesleeanus TaxID=4837 RepID=A0ABR3AUY2_PHYBL
MILSLFFFSTSSCVVSIPANNTRRKKYVFQCILFELSFFIIYTNLRRFYIIDTIKTYFSYNKDRIRLYIRCIVLIWKCY